MDAEAHSKAECRQRLQHVERALAEAHIELSYRKNILVQLARRYISMTDFTELPFTVETIQGKGLGCVATTRGTVVHDELLGRSESLSSSSLSNSASERNLFVLALFFLSLWLPPPVRTGMSQIRAPRGAGR